MDQNADIFCSTLKKAIDNRSGCGMVLLIHGPQGIEAHVNTADPTFMFGIMRAALIAFEEKYKEGLRVLTQVGSSGNLDLNVNFPGNKDVN